MESQSEQIEKIAIALSKAQSVITGAIKDSKNPFFNSMYADLASIWDAIRKPLTDNDLAVIQTLDESNSEIFLITKLIHISGQWFSGKLKLILTNKKDMQALGSAITYARRYSLAAIMGVPQVDDDANACSPMPPQRRQQQAKQSPTDVLRILVAKHTDGCKNEEKVAVICEKLGVEKLDDIKDTPDNIKLEMISYLKEIKL